MNSTERSATSFMVGLGIGIAVALLLAPQSGEKTREWIENTANNKVKLLRRKGQQSIAHLQVAIAAGGETVSRALKSSKVALDSVSAKLN